MQFTDEDLDAAVADGAITADAVKQFRGFLERRRAAPAADEESFRLLTGFSDIFVAIAIAMVLIALGWLSRQYLGPSAGLVVAVASWGLAEFFTRVRRMALPSLLLLGAFVGGVVSATVSVLPAEIGEPDAALKALAWGGAGAIAAFAHWWRFKVPVTVAAGALTLGAAGVGAVDAYTQSPTAALYATLVAGLIVFGLALAWDMSDPLRKTRRADVAFWLHLLAAPAIVHSGFSLLGLTASPWLMFDAPALTEPPPDGHRLLLACGAVAIYALIAVVALIVDRRALMVSGLLYLLYAATVAFRAGGAATLSFALSALIVGAGLLLLSAFWATVRRGVLGLTPRSWRARLPPAA